MQKSSEILHHNFADIKLNIRSGIGVCLGIFLFLLFFQPFVPQSNDFNSNLLILAGFGGMTLLLLGIMRLVIPYTFPGIFLSTKWNTTKESIYDFIFVALNTVAYSFFARYVGKIPVSFHIVTILSIISISAIVIIVFTSNYQALKKQAKDTQLVDHKLHDEKTKHDPKIIFESENKTDFLKLEVKDLILIKSASNYVEVIFKKDGEVNKKLIRNTMKSTEQLLSKYYSLLRCHRSFIINKNYIENIEKGNEGLILSLTGYSSKIHVSRKYILKVKEALNKD